MRFKFSLEVLPHISGNVLPISYQYELANSFRRLLTANEQAFQHWLEINGIELAESAELQYYSISNLYIPKIYVEGDRLHVNVPRIQFWASFLPEVGTHEFINNCFADCQFSIGDNVSSVSFRVQSIDDVSPVFFSDKMEYQCLSPVAVVSYRSNNSLEYLSPSSPYFAQFIYDGIVERYEAYYCHPFEGQPGFCFQLLSPERRKSVNIITDSGRPRKVVGYMFKFRLEMDPLLQEFAYTSGIGEYGANGFGYIELLKKRK